MSGYPKHSPLRQCHSNRGRARSVGEIESSEAGRKMAARTGGRIRGLTWQRCKSEDVRGFEAAGVAVKCSSWQPCLSKIESIFEKFPRVDNKMALKFRFTIKPTSVVE